MKKKNKIKVNYYDVKPISVKVKLTVIPKEYLKLFPNNDLHLFKNEKICI